ncbi:SusD/RagB family nutrient-binding outer membrane lipoprotein [Polaribacter sp. ALD11]|uniref:SusD/RagB family nutrient-binding outer membrane lipoprotein n=1 Tax=Polaribacter sp. ALD11 TaxID=2058137 RepID=UPI000C308F27|nr:SusD/RagB family nutrient-binding outer membrane lipoprotein [Polaribacter sp. ALD11]AUC86364.1 SusD/RagB family nutrient-binding outer membrane lipoprotein [Polaribacter sp. ALD11]
MKKYIITVAIFASIFASCTKEFEEINTNQNSPVNVQPSLLLRQVIYDFGEQMSYEGFAAGNLLSQHYALLDFNLFDRHDLKSPQLGGNPWSIFFKNLRDNEIIIKKSRKTPAFAVYEGPTLILKAYMAAALTDIFGDVPYFEAFNGVEGTVTPKYDLQEDIYQKENGILNNLDKGIAAINAYSGSIPLEGDILFNGDLNSWIRFANSLKIKYLVRISDKVNVASQLQTLFSDDNYIKNNNENATFDFTNTAPNSFRFAQLRVGDFTNFIMSETAEDIFKNLNDSRVGKFYQPFENATSNEFNGLINGINSSTTTPSPDNYSLVGKIFREDTSSLDANFMTAWETQFLLAEAAQKGLINTNPETLYNNGVMQAFEYWNTNLPTTYLTGNASLNAVGKTPLEQIITQKWIANTINGYESWIEYRRTGFPVLKNVAASLNNGLIPVRMPYPADAGALNTENYKVAATATNGNSLDVKVWWNE